MPDMPRVLPQMPPLPPSFEFEKDGNVMFFGSNRHIGITVTSLTEQLGDYFGAQKGKGVLISSVRENSPAGKAGLQAGDVVVEVDGKEVKGAFDLTRLINEKKEGAVNLTVIRNRSRINVSVEPEKSDRKMRIITPDENGKLNVTPKTLISPKVVIDNAPGIIL
jgi:C-terminal processing protease CtpA/Prc